MFNGFANVSAIQKVHPYFDQRMKIEIQDLLSITF